MQNNLVAPIKKITLPGCYYGLKGEVEWCVVNQDGSIAQDGGKQNLILDSGLDMIGTPSGSYNLGYAIPEVMENCAVGTGNSTPIVAQNALDTEIARTNNYLLSPQGSCGSFLPDAYTLQHVRTFDFPLGSINTTIYEAGFSPITTPGNNLFSRVLLNAPTGITVTSLQILRLKYTLTVTYGVANTWTTDTVTITGIGDIGYGVDVAQYKYRSQYIGYESGGTPTRYDNTFFTNCVDVDTGHTSPGKIKANAANAMSGEPGNYWLTGNPAYTSANHTTGVVLFANTTYVDETYVDAQGTILGAGAGHNGWGALISTVIGTNKISNPTENNDNTFRFRTTASPFTDVSGGGPYSDRFIFMDVNQGNGDIQWLTGPGYVNPYGFNMNGNVYFFTTPITKTNHYTLQINFRTSWGRV
jgi:hypothetical protein